MPPQDTTSDEVRAFRGRTSPERVALIDALAHPSRPARRLLEMARTWPGSLPDEVPEPAAYQTYRQLRPAEVAELVAAYEVGATVYELAAQFGIHRITVGRLLRARGVDTKPPGLYPADVPKAAELYRAGWSLARIATKFDTAARTVRARLLEVGVVMRQRGRQKL